jgi:hypothetical protein
MFRYRLSLWGGLLSLFFDTNYAHLWLSSTILLFYILPLRHGDDAQFSFWRKQTLDGVYVNAGCLTSGLSSAPWRYNWTLKTNRTQVRILICNLHFCFYVDQMSRDSETIIYKVTPQKPYIQHPSQKSAATVPASSPQLAPRNASRAHPRRWRRKQRLRLAFSRLCSKTYFYYQSYSQ